MKIFMILLFIALCFSFINSEQTRRFLQSQDQQQTVKENVAVDNIFNTLRSQYNLSDQDLILLSDIESRYTKNQQTQPEKSQSTEATESTEVPQQTLESNSEDEFDSFFSFYGPAESESTQVVNP